MSTTASTTSKDTTTLALLPKKLLEGCDRRQITPGRLLSALTPGSRHHLCRMLNRDQNDMTIELGKKTLGLLKLIELKPVELDSRLAPGLGALELAARKGHLAARAKCDATTLKKELVAQGLTHYCAKRVVRRGPTMLSHLPAWSAALEKFGSVAPLTPVEIATAQLPRQAQATPFTAAHRALFATRDTTLKEWSRQKGYNWTTVRNVLTGEITGKRGLAREICGELNDAFGAEGVNRVIEVARKCGADSTRRFRSRSEERRRNDLQEKLVANGMTKSSFARTHGVKLALVTSVILGRLKGTRGKTAEAVAVLESLPDRPSRPDDHVEAFFYDRDTTLKAWSLKHDTTPKLAREALQGIPIAGRNWRQLHCRIALSRDFGIPDSTGGLADTAHGILAASRRYPSLMAAEIGVSRQAVDLLLKGVITVESRAGVAAVRYLVERCGVTPAQAAAAIAKGADPAATKTKRRRQ